MKKILAAVASIALMCGTVQPAHALFGVGDIVIDPSNLAQNILTATRALQMVNNQIHQLQNDAQMLINQAKNLQQLDFNALTRLRATLATTQALFDAAQGLAFEVSRVRDSYERLYPTLYSAATTRAQLSADQVDRWTNSREALGTALQVQSQVRQNFAADASVLADVVTHSQAAVGELQATQSTNQLLALQVRQLMQGQELQIAGDRAAALEKARVVAAEGRARELRRRFMTRATRYTPESVNAFN